MAKKTLKIKLVVPNFRITFVHFPLILISFVIGYFTRTVGFIWLAVLVVGSEFAIVISRFIFEYEQAFQGDLVRFWYSALYLFASAYALMHEGHVRVDVLYTGFNERKKALSFFQKYSDGNNSKRVYDSIQNILLNPRIELPKLL